MRITSRHTYLLILDLAIAAVSLWVAFVIRFDGAIPENYREMLPLATLVFVIVRVAFYSLAGLYRSLWRYASLYELLAIVLAVGVGSLVLYVVDAVAGLYDLPLSVYGIEFMTTMLGIGGVRFAVRMRRIILFGDRLKDAQRALIVGAGDAGLMLLREFENQPQLGVRVVGFVDDDPAKMQHRIRGIPVRGPRSAIPQLVEALQIDQIIIAMPSAPQPVIQETIALCKQARVQLKILPPIADVIDGKVRAQDVRDVEIEDLLRREPVQTDLDAISNYLEGRRVLITGAGGSIGSELCRQVARFRPSALYLLGHGENSIFEIHNELIEAHPGLEIYPIIEDIQNETCIRRIFERVQPQVVFHAAAHKHVPLMEANPEAAVRNNVFGTRNVAEAAARTGVETFVMISTDKAVNPGNVMGATKRMAELVVQSMAESSSTRFVSVRFGNVLGSRGSVVPFFKKQIAQGGPVTVTHPEMRRYFMTIPEAVQLVLQAGSIGRGGEVFVLDMGEPVRIVDLARDLIRLSGFEPGRDIEIVFTGIRPGEKLFEELINDGESVRATEHEKIRALNGRPPSRAAVQRILDELQRLLDASATDELVATLYAAVDAKPVMVEGSAALAAKPVARGEMALRQAAAAKEAEGE